MCFPKYPSIFQVYIPVFYFQLLLTSSTSQESSSSHSTLFLEQVWSDFMFSKHLIWLNRLCLGSKLWLPIRICSQWCRMLKMSSNRLKCQQFQNPSEETLNWECQQKLSCSICPRLARESYFPRKIRLWSLLGPGNDCPHIGPRE